jgi:myo-inositol catabolism protein IolC
MSYPLKCYNCGVAGGFESYLAFLAGTSTWDDSGKVWLLGKGGDEDLCPACAARLTTLRQNWIGVRRQRGVPRPGVL